MESINRIIDKIPIGNTHFVKQIPIEQVDELADELVAEYGNPTFRKWYCGVIKKFGVPKVHEWRRRASEGDHPGRLFTTYVNQAGGYRSSSYEKK